MAGLTSNPVTAQYAQALSLLGYQTVEEVLGASQSAADAMTRYLGADIRAQLPPPPPGLFAAGLEPTFPLGVALDQIPPLALAFAMPPVPAGALPPVVNLASDMPPIRSQQDRGTCVAFSSLAALENLRTSQGHFQDMSEQFLYWNCKQHDGRPNGEGTFVGIAMPRLQQEGCCLETTWAYDRNVIAGNESHNPPPTGAITEAVQFRVASINQLPATSVAAIKTELARGRAVAFSIPVFNSWYQNPAVRASGDLVLPFPGEAVVGGHAMCMCGYRDDAADPGGGRFFLRNSWGLTWGVSAANGSGYGTIPYTYITNFGAEAFSVE